MDEIELVKYLSQGLVTKEIAYQSGCTFHTVKNKIQRTLHKYECRNSTQLVAYFLRNKLID